MPWLLILALAVGAAAPAQTGDDATREILDRAVRLLQEGDALEALMQVERVLSRDPDLLEAHLLQGRSLQALGDDLGARDAFLQATRVAPGTADAHFLAAAASLRMADFEVAWEQAILAAQAGREQQMDRLLDALEEQAPPPADLRERLAAPRLSVEPSPELDPTVTRAVRQAVLDAPSLALVRRPAGHRIELDGAGSELLVRLLDGAGRVILERTIPVPQGATDPALVEAIGEIRTLLHGDEGRRP